MQCLNKIKFLFDKFRLLKCGNKGCKVVPLNYFSEIAEKTMKNLYDLYKVRDESFGRNYFSRTQ